MVHSGHGTQREQSRCPDRQGRARCRRPNERASHSHRAVAGVGVEHLQLELLGGRDPKRVVDAALLDRRGLEARLDKQGPRGVDVVVHQVEARLEWGIALELADDDVGAAAQLDDRELVPADDRPDAHGLEPTGGGGHVAGPEEDMPGGGEGAVVGAHAGRLPHRRLDLTRVCVEGLASSIERGGASRGDFVLLASSAVHPSTCAVRLCLFAGVLAGSACANTVPESQPLDRQDSPAPSSEAPVDSVDTDDETFTQVSAGWGFACALRADKSLICWGEDDLGQSSLAPAGQFDSVKAGFGYACAIESETHQLSCWGRNDEFEAGWLAGNVPQGQFDAVYLAERRACAIRSESGHLVCWWNDGDRDVVWDNEGWARDISFASAWIDRDFICGVRTDNGELACSPTSSERKLPAGPFVEVYNHCALRGDGQVVCFPVAYKYAQEPVPALRFDHLATGSGFEPCGLEADSGRVMCWHGDAAGLGEPPDTAFTSLSTSWGLACAIRASDGQPQCWGKHVDEGLLRPTPPKPSRRQEATP